MISKALGILEDMWLGIKVVMVDYGLIYPFVYWMTYLIFWTHTN